MATTSWIDALRVAARPFVTRSLRAGRGRRFVALALVLLVGTVAMGLWLAQGSGPLERRFREGIEVEQRRELREHREFVVFADTDEQAQILAREIEQQRSTGTPVGRGSMTASGAIWLRAAMAEPVPAGHREHAAFLAIQDRAAELLDRHGADTRVPGRVPFSWYDANDVARVRSILDRELVPAVVRYASPLDVTATSGVVGLLATLIALVLVLGIAPVLAGIAAAQESHENTLQPLAGTALRPRQLALGLAIGACVPVLIVAAPLLVVAAVAAIATTGALAWLALLALMLASAWALTLLAQTTGLFAGRKRTPGPIAVSLLAVLGTWLLVGAAIGFAKLGREDVAMMTLLPSGALTHLARLAFVADVDLTASVPLQDGFRVGVLAATLVAVVLGGLALLATERRILGRHAPPLRRGEALVGSTALSAIVLLALSSFADDLAWFAGLAALVMPLQILLMGRVPNGDAPSGTRSIAIGSLLTDFWAMVGVYAALSLLTRPLGGVLEALPATLEVGYALTIAALVALRVVAAPAKLGASIWAGFAFVFAIVCFGAGVARTDSHHTPLLVFGEIHPLLGVVQLALYVAFPWTLVAALTPRRVAVAPSLATDP